MDVVNSLGAVGCAGGKINGHIRQVLGKVNGVAASTAINGPGQLGLVLKIDGVVSGTADQIFDIFNQIQPARFIIHFRCGNAAPFVDRNVKIIIYI